MKTYKQMAHDVLKRRDEILANTTNNANKLLQQTISTAPEKVYPAAGKKRLLPRILIPCGAAVTAAAVGLVVWNVSRPRTAPEYNNVNVAAGGNALDANPDIAPADGNNNTNHTDYSDVYKGGNTEINYNKITEKDICIYNLPVLNRDDFIAIPDDEINEFYDFKFDRLNEILGEGEHEPFGYYNRDIESDGALMHAVHGQYNLNSIQYSHECSKVTVSASYNEYDTATIESAKPSVINGFDAVIYICGEEDDQNITLAADININGAYVSITAVYSSTDCLVDYISYPEHCKDLFEKILDSYTAPISVSCDTKTNEFNILDEMPQIIRDNDPFKPIDTDGLAFNAMTIEETNSYYNIEFNRLGNLHSDWDERGKDKLGIYRKENPSVETSDGAAAGSMDIPRSQINTLKYVITNGKYLNVSANIGSIPGIVAEDGEYYRHSFINGLDAVIYRNPTAGFDLGAMIQIGGTVVDFTSTGLYDEEFAYYLREFTRKNGVTEVHYGNPSPTEIHYVKTDRFIQTPDAPNLDENDFNKLTIKELNRYYGWELDRLGTKYPDWSAESYDFGYYKRGDDVYYSRNTITYSTDNGGTVTVSAQKEPFDSPINFGYDAEPSYVNSYIAEVFVDKNGDFLADLEMNSYVRITASGISKDEFENILCEFTELYGYDFVE